MTYSIYTHRCNLTDKFLIEHDRKEAVCRTCVFKAGGTVLVNRWEKCVRVYVPFKDTPYVTLDGITKANFNIACHIARDTEGWVK